MTKMFVKLLTKEARHDIAKVFGKASFRALAISLLFIISGIGASVLIAPASAAPNSAAPSAASPVSAAASLTAAEANWEFPNGNAFNQDYNPQNQINSSNAQYLGVNWLFPLPTRPNPLLSYSGTAGQGVDSAPMLINGTIYMIAQYGQVFALNAANGDVEWNDVLPIKLNSTAGISGISGIALHLHDGSEQFTTQLFGGTPTLWYAAPDLKVYAINALTGAYELNFTYFTGMGMVQGNSPTAIESPIAPNLLVDQSRGIVITSIGSGSSAATGRCFYRAWNVLAKPVQPLWTTYCTPPQPNSNLPLDPSWDIQQVNNMSSAEIFYPGPAYNGGGPIPGTAVVNLKTLSSSVLNSTLYNDWGYSNQSPSCLAADGGAATGSTAAGWGAAWLLGTGPTSGMAFVNTNNRDPYNSACTLGPGLWAASILALNETTGQWIWGFQATPHDMWDYDCSWWQAMGNETINGVNTQVIFKTCKSGYLFELNAKTGNLIWAWTPPSNILARCQNCYLLNPLNATQMSYPYFAPDRLGPTQATLCTPCSFAFESEASYDPVTNMVYTVSDNNPRLTYYIAINSTNYKSTPGWAQVPVAGQTATEGTYDNCTAEAVNAATGQMVWDYYIPNQGYRGGMTTSGNVLYLTMSSGDLIMLDATKGTPVKDLFIGGPLNELPVVGATVTGKEEVLIPITPGLVTWGTSVPGDLVALSLQAQPGGVTTTTTTVTASGSPGSVSTTTVVSTSTTTVTSGGIGSVTYGIAAVAVIFIIVSGYLAMRGRKPAS